MATKEYLDHFRRQHEGEIQFVHNATLKKTSIPTTDATTESRTAIEMYRAGEISAPEMRRLLNIMQINGLDKSQIHDLPYSVLKKITG